jgi:hypothetical protein
MTRSTLLHLRIPFSFYLLPVFLFAFSVSDNVSVSSLIIIAVALHLFLYPASNGYNSYFDKDEESIGGLEKPPAVNKDLYWYSLLFDFVALGLGCFISWQFVLLMFVYGLVSKAYSHPSIRLKKMPYAGWLVAGFFQGYFSFIIVYLGLNSLSISDLFIIEIQMPAILSSLLLCGSYPMTQIYQHAEDKKRGDITISLKLGVLGTFHFTAIAFFIATQGFLFFYYTYYSFSHALVYMAFLTPILIFFGYWYIKSRRDLMEVNFSNTMKLNFISAFFLNIFFLAFYFFK